MQMFLHKWEKMNTETLLDLGKKNVGGSVVIIQHINLSDSNTSCSNPSVHLSSVKELGRHPPI